MTDVRTALEAVGLLDGLLRLPEGLDTELRASGHPLLPNQLRLLMIARALAASPQLILLDELLDGLGDRQLDSAVAALTDDAKTWTVMIATNRADVARRFSRTIDLQLRRSSRPTAAHDGEATH